MKRFAIILLVSFFCTGLCYAQDDNTYLRNLKKASLLELEQERTTLIRDIKWSQKEANSASDKLTRIAYNAQTEHLKKFLKFTNEEIARRPKPRNQVAENRNDALACENQERADRIRQEERRLKQQAYEAAMARTQLYYDNLKANAAYHASAEGIAVALSVVDPTHYMNPGQADYIPSETPGVQSRDRRVVRQRLQHLRSVQYAEVDEEKEETNDDDENRTFDENGYAPLEQLVDEFWRKFWAGMNKLKTDVVQWGYEQFYFFAPDYYKNGWENWTMARDIVSYQRMLADSNYRNRIMNQAADPRSRSVEWYFDDWYRSGYKSLERINTRMGNRVPSQYFPLNRVRRTNQMIKKAAATKVKEYVGNNGGELVKIVIEKE